MDSLQYYVRQLRNMKGRIPIDAMTAATLTDYAAVVGQLLAKGHAGTSGASMIAGYIGDSDRVDKALRSFARRYVDQTKLTTPHYSPPSTADYFRSNAESKSRTGEDG